MTARSALLALLLSATSAGGQTLYNDTANNIHDTYDPLCDGSDPSIVWCEGFEDGTWGPWYDEPLNSNNDAAWDTNNLDGWTIDAAFGTLGGQLFRQPAVTLGTSGGQYVNCNAGGFDVGLDDEDVADFGAAGTPCTSSSDWVDSSTTSPGDPVNGRNGLHAFLLDASDNPTADGNYYRRDLRASGTWHWYVRFYFKESGVTSQRCPGGTPCPAFSQFATGNGYKVIQTNANRSLIGLGGALLGAGNAPGSVGEQELFNMVSACGATDERTCYQDGDVTPSVPLNKYDCGMGPGTSFNHNDFLDHWIFVEAEYLIDGVNGTMRLWMDDCGKDGRGCTGTPTLRIEATGLDLTWTDTTNSVCDEMITMGGPRTLWFNWDNTSMQGEILVDEIVVRDGEVTASPIGFASVFDASPGNSTSGGGSIQ